MLRSVSLKFSDKSGNFSGVEERYLAVSYRLIISFLSSLKFSKTLEHFSGVEERYLGGLIIPRSGFNSRPRKRFFRVGVAQW